MKSGIDLILCNNAYADFQRTIQRHHDHIDELQPHLVELWKGVRVEEAMHRRNLQRRRDASVENVEGNQLCLFFLSQMIFVQG